MIDAQTRKLARLQESITASKMRIAATQREFDQRNRSGRCLACQSSPRCSELKHEKETILVHFQQLKAQMSKSRGRERQQLIELTVQVPCTTAHAFVSRRCSRARRATRSSSASSWPSRFCARQKYVASLRRRKKRSCRSTPRPSRRRNSRRPAVRFRAPCQQWQACAAHLLSDEELVVAAKLAPAVSDLSSDAVDDQGNSVNSIHALDNFWKRFNKVRSPPTASRIATAVQALLDKLAVEHELKNLTDENEQLRALLKRYLDGPTMQYGFNQADTHRVQVSRSTRTSLPKTTHSSSSTGAPTPPCMWLCLRRRVLTPCQTRAGGRLARQTRHCCHRRGASCEQQPEDGRPDVMRNA